MKPSTRTLLSLALCACLLTACGADGEDDDNDAGNSWRPEPAASTEIGSDGFTPPDAVLTLGDTAVVPLLEEGSFDDPDVTGSLEVTVSEPPVKGSLDDLPTDGLFADELEGTPYYVTFTVKNVGEVALEGVLISMTGVDTTGEDLDSSARSDLTECAGGIPQTFGPGDSATACSVVLVEDNELAAVGYDEAEAYDDDPVLWDLT